MNTQTRPGTHVADRLVIVSHYHFGPEHVQRIEARGAEYHFAGLDAAGLAALPAVVKDRAAVFIGAANHVDEHFFNVLPHVQWIHHPAAGINTNEKWIDWALMQRHGVTVTATKIHGDSISEMIVTYLLMLAKAMPAHAAQQRARSFSGQRTILLKGTTALIVGTGTIGKETARKLKTAFGMRVIGINTDGRPVEFCDAVYTLSDLPRLLPESDAVILTIPVTEKTEHLFDRAMLNRMKKTAFLVNVSRGTLIQEDDLAAALRDGTIAGAGLDTFEKEPLPPESPLWGMENVIITPHVSGGFKGYSARVMDTFLENFEYFQRGESPAMPDRANEKGY